ncbi:MAG: zinc-dependent dehydrogenase [Chloroflexi bacterium]|nr:zinc-dependent dehydrogenase [Chloroflexota bacterium]
MRVAMYYRNNDVRVEEKPVPKIGQGELLVRVDACGICGSDVLEWYRVKKAPLVLGHEIAATIVEVGKDVKSYKTGDRIAIAHHVPCNTCHYCLTGNHTACNTLRSTNIDPGGFAEYVRIPAINVDRGVFAIPDGMSDGEATFIEPLACVIRGQRRANLRIGGTVLVLGSGMAGLLHIHLARLLGAGKIFATDITDFRLKAARQFGADVTINGKEYTPEKLREMNKGLLADLVIVCAGAGSVLEQAMNSVERGGTVLFFALSDPGVILPVSINEFFVRNEVMLTTSYAGSPADYQAALDLIATGTTRIKDMITHRLGLKDSALGFQLVAAAKDSIKVIIEPFK